MCICTYLCSVYLIFARVESWHGRATGDQSLCQTSPGGTTLRYSFLLLGLLWLNKKKSGDNSFQTVRHHQEGERLHFLNNYFYLYLCVFLIPHIISRILLDSWNKHGSTWYQIKYRSTSHSRLVVFRRGSVSNTYSCQKVNVIQPNQSEGRCKI